MIRILHVVLYLNNLKKEMNKIKFFYFFFNKNYYLSRKSDTVVALLSIPFLKKLASSFLRCI